MRVDRPGPGEELNPGEESPARPAASLIVLRDSPEGPEVLLVQRNPDARFMGGAWVFPGGAVDEGDGGPDGAALREAQEEAGLRLPGTDSLVPFSRWITPSEVKIRFDTWFFVAEAPADAEVTCDGQECVDHRWIRPVDALAAYSREEMLLVFPTIKHLEALAEFRSVDAALEDGRSRQVEPVQPRVVMKGDHAAVLLPGEPGYDEA
ncbi:MAG: NUDIX domain-containing protein [Thermoleophilaceae bacterium]